MPPYDKPFVSPVDAFFTTWPTTPPRPTALVRKSDAQIAQELSAAQSDKHAHQRTSALRASQKRLSDHRVAEAERKIEALRREQESRRSLKAALDRLAAVQEKAKLRVKLSGTLLIEAYDVRYIVRNVDLDDATSTRLRGEYKPASTLSSKSAGAWSPRGLFTDYTVIEKLCG